MHHLRLLKICILISFCFISLQSKGTECRQYLASSAGSLPKSIIQSLNSKPVRSLNDWVELPESLKVDLLKGNLNDIFGSMNLNKSVFMVQDLSHLRVRFGHNPSVLKMLGIINSEIRPNNFDNQTTIGAKNFFFEFYTFNSIIVGVRFIATQFATPEQEGHPSDGHFMNIGAARAFNVPENQIFDWSVEVIFEFYKGDVFILSPKSADELKLQNTGRTYFQ